VSQNNKNQENKKSNPNSGLNPYVKYSGIALQMMISIAGATWGGVLLDDHFKMEKPIWTIVCSLAGVGIALFLIIRSVNKMSDEG